MKKIMLVILFLSFGVSQAFAENASGTVTTLGCHNVDEVCYVSLSNFTATSLCNKDTSIRWDTSTPWGKRWFAAFMMAKALGTTVSLQMSDSSCSAQGYPTFLYGNM